MNRSNIKKTKQEIESLELDSLLIRYTDLDHFLTIERVLLSVALGVVVLQLLVHRFDLSWPFSWSLLTTVVLTVSLYILLAKVALARAGKSIWDQWRLLRKTAGYRLIRSQLFHGILNSERRAEALRLLASAYEEAGALIMSPNDPMVNASY